MTTHEDFMRMAIEVAKESEAAKGIAVGAVLVQGGQVIAKGTSSVWPDKDPSGHGETNCIRAACKQLGAVNLVGCVLYGTLEPCGMCLSCAAWANLNELYFGAYCSNVAGNPYEIENYSAEERAKGMRAWSGTPMQVTGGILRDECAALLRGYKNWSKQ